MKEIDKLLIESRTIADEVYDTCTSIKDNLIWSMHETKTEKRDGYGIKTNKIKSDIFGTEYTITYNLFIIYPHTDPRHFRHGAIVDNENKTLRLNILEVGGEIVPLTFDDALQHELEHIYQTKRKVLSVLFFFYYFINFIN